MALVDDLRSLLRRSGGNDVAVSNCSAELRRRRREDAQVEALRAKVAARVAERRAPTRADATERTTGVA